MFRDVKRVFLLRLMYLPTVCLLLLMNTCASALFCFKRHYMTFIKSNVYFEDVKVVFYCDI